MVAVAAAGFVLWQIRPYQLPAPIKNQAKFGLYIPPRPPAGYQLKTDSVKLSTLEGDSVLSFILTSPNGDVTISQQAYPDALIYDKFTNSLSPDDETNTSLGTLTIGHPKDAGGGQVAGLKVGNTLLLGRPTHDLPTGTWQVIIGSLELAK